MLYYYTRDTTPIVSLLEPELGLTPSSHAALGAILQVGLCTRVLAPTSFGSAPFQSFPSPAATGSIPWAGLHILQVMMLSIFHNLMGHGRTVVSRELTIDFFTTLKRASPSRWGGSKLSLFCLKIDGWLGAGCETLS